MNNKTWVNRKTISLAVIWLIALISCLFVVTRGSLPITAALSGNQPFTVTIENEKVNPITVPGPNPSEASTLVDLAPYDLNHFGIKSITINSAQPNNQLSFGYLSEYKVFNSQFTINIQTNKTAKGYSATLTSADIAKMQTALKFQPRSQEITVAIILMIASVLTCIFLIRRLSTKIATSLVTLVVYLAGLQYFTSTQHVNASKLALMIVLMIGLLAAALSTKNAKLKKWLIAGIYLAALILSFFKIDALNKVNYYGFDEQSTIAYIDNITQHPSLIPDYKTMGSLSANWTSPTNDGKGGTIDWVLANKQTMLNQGFTVSPDKRDPGTINYLGHPPLYYQIMKLVGAKNIGNDTTFFNYKRMWLVTIGFFLAGLAIYFYIAWSRLKSEQPLIHFTIAAGAAASTLLQNIFFGLNSDSLAFLIVAVFSLGAIRFVENKRGWPTYLTIFASLTLAGLTKNTVLVTIAIASLSLLIWDFFARKGRIYKDLKFWISALVLSPLAAFFVILIKNYHTIFLSIENYAPATWRATSLYGDYYTQGNFVEPFHTLEYMMQRTLYPLLFNNQPSDMVPFASTKTLLSPLPPIFFIAIFGFAGIILLASLNLKRQLMGKWSPFFMVLAIAACVTFVMLFKQILPSSFGTFRKGGYQSRYFMQYIPIALIGLGFFLQKWFGGKGRAKTHGLIILLTGAATVLLIEQSLLIFLSYLTN